MNVVITGGGGFLGRRLADALLAEGIPSSGGQSVPVSKITLADRAEFAPFEDARAEYFTGDIAEPEFLARAIGPETQIVYHLAAVVSSEAEADFDLGMRVNVDASRGVLERCRQLGHCPRVVFTSSVAVFGPSGSAVRPEIDPRSSYGAEKAIAELLLKEYSRRGFVDGIVLRLPTISIRPGRPNRAASSFASGILREPLSGREAICPVPLTTRLWLLSARRAAANLRHAAGLALGSGSNAGVIDLPGVSVSVEEMLEALERASGAEARALIRMMPDPAVEAIVASWPDRWDDAPARGLGFAGDADIDEIVRAFLEDDLSAQLAMMATSA